MGFVRLPCCNGRSLSRGIIINKNIYTYIADLSYMHRSFPTFTIFCHASTIELEDPEYCDRWYDREKRPHDPPISDFLNPIAALDALKLELGLTEKNLRENTITVVSSPFRCCLETSALLAHALGISSVRVHYGIGDDLEGSRKAGYDCIYGGPLYLSESEMQHSISMITDLLTPLVDIDIERISGEPAPWTEEGSSIRMCDAIDEIRFEMTSDDEHVIVVTHKEVLAAVVNRYAVRNSK